VEIELPVTGGLILKQSAGENTGIRGNEVKGGRGDMQERIHNISFL
jgi:hypothetical protein